VRQNPERRAALTDAAIRVLGRAGARGLTYRSVEVEAEVPPGTASNYFRNRTDLLQQVAQRIHERARPSEGQLRQLAGVPPSHQRVVELLQAARRRVLDDRDLHLALLELRLEATRHQPLRAPLTATVRADLAANFAFHRAAGLPGDSGDLLLLHLALTGLLLEQLTLPDTLGGADADALIAELVGRLVPAAEPQAVAGGSAPASGARHASPR
jgi:AcrR family transcriptional regulator